MPAIALQAFTVAGEDARVFELLPGDAVPGYDRFDYAVQRALRETGRVRDLELDVMHLSSEGGRLHFKLWAKPEPETEPAPAEAPAAFSCEVCAQSGFKSESGLKAHVTRKHPGRAA